MGIEIQIDLTSTQKRAEQAAALLRDLQIRHDLAPFEFSSKVRIAPYEIPHSHPVLTLNTFTVDDPDRFLATYLHEQAHWYLVDHKAQETEQMIAVLRTTYPDAPNAAAERARDDMSVLLHLIVNWLEIEAITSVLSAEAARRIAETAIVYPWGYRTVLQDRAVLGSMLDAAGISPMPDARTL